MENIIHENKNSKSTVKRFIIVIYHKRMKIRVIFHKINCKICQSWAILFLLFLMCDLILFLMLILKTATLLITQVKYVKIWTKHTSFRKDFIYIEIINKIFFYSKQRFSSINILEINVIISFFSENTCIYKLIYVAS